MDGVMIKQWGRVTDDLANQLREALAKGIDDDAMKRVKKQVDEICCEIEDDVVYRLQDNLAQMLTAFVVEMAKCTVTSILEGNQREMERYLGCERGTWTGRSDSPQWGRKREDHEWHSVIHGELFDQGAVRLRRELVEAHRDLITNQRILDLEDQVRSLVAQVNKVENEKAGLEDRLRHVA